MSDRRYVRGVSTAAVAAAFLMLLLWQRAHGGVPSHHLFDRADLPAFSNWWGGLLLPLMTWFLIGRTQKRIALQGEGARRYALFGFAAAVLFGVLLSVFFTLDIEAVSNGMFESLFLLALFLPIYRAECLLGLVLGMAYTFGGVLPSIIGSVMALITMVIYCYVRAWLLCIGYSFAGMFKRSRT
ncbi:hypothetical protein [Dyella mobilis]|uniref:Tripartite tricarboxylate transporter TctB family protein n=1 Tax=Dyella mobilis TaxID=1849582 RepID=A0ABS2KEA0_9GAMM|nr:hypothetical protein [Dyella mobilis]MBM7129502.1 hypothetical protein [Dyella mobilis]GLQ98233.1 hypothetical protein GCM10007863_26530 [Dyella mobilis]